MGLCVCVEEVTLIRINLWLTLFKKHRHHSSGGLHQTLRCTSQAQLLFMIWPAHFLSPALMPPHSHPRPLRYHLSFEAYPERWIIASSWPSTSFPMSGSTVQHADRDPYTFFFLIRAPLHSHRSLCCIAGQPYSCHRLRSLSLYFFFHRFVSRWLIDSCCF